MTNKQKANTYATIGTILFLVLLFLLLWFVYISAPKDIDEEGVEVAFGEVEDAGGYEAEESEAMPMEAVVPPTPAAPSNNDLMTQEDEEALALQRQREKEQREQKAKEEAERKAREQALAEQRAKEDAEKQKAQNLVGGLFGGNGSGQGNTGNSGTSGSGTGSGAGNQGNPIGKGTQGGNSWSLSGRGIRGTLPQPSNDFKQDGRVIVEIRVNAAGTVVSATHKGGTISDKQTIQLALEAAKKAKFTEGDHDQIGTITYNFKFN